MELLPICYWTLLLLAPVLLAFLVYKIYFQKKREIPKNTVLLYQMGRGPHAPSVSPFPMKLETYLRMAKIPYMSDHSVTFSSKGKLPWMVYNGKPVADSQFCIEYLNKKLGINLNKAYADLDVSVGRAFQKMAEEEFYWTMCAVTFGEDLTEVKKVLPYKGIELWIKLTAIKHVVQKEMWGHGIGRHNSKEIWSIGERDLHAISTFLGKKKYFLGDEPSEVDCAMFAMLAMVKWNMPNTPHESLMKKLTNLGAYCERMKERYWPDWEECSRLSKKFKDDSYILKNRQKSK
ncbi:failed axon connections homolog isoform X1 [Octopus sinensis]|uniref:Failed axon connections homolog isoform X1 n=1 Tax=Octopus sinensis TaxID=2607531 RepID=A0A6P7TNS3_9MOLL|nr:failed axon connections homolog isoform X1 [Octopus sinensis]